MGIEAHNQQSIHEGVLVIGSKNYRAFGNTLPSFNNDFSVKYPKSDCDIDAEKGIPQALHE